ncbi:Transmembrane domain-containing protein [Spironucleus salmonicida]|uniref:Transmembrane domain-containing protein n=1 Tax=Spironucleus salmonicida TaxID=348837 RepID=V6LJV8_9EUKA|nr:Transmembrane domain-containing protein [Spironucleus salmonicida]|eukprot:EST44006.1 Transmembrane domain-containing protein [Spironucleus salmonicida]
MDIEVQEQKLYKRRVFLSIIAGMLLGVFSTNNYLFSIVLPIILLLPVRACVSKVDMPTPILIKTALFESIAVFYLGWFMTPIFLLKE